MTGKPPGVWEPSSTASICASPLTWKGGYNTVQHMGTTEEVRTQHRRNSALRSTFYIQCVRTHGVITVAVQLQRVSVLNEQ